MRSEMPAGCSEVTNPGTRRSETVRDFASDFVVPPTISRTSRPIAVAPKGDDQEDD